MTLSWKQPSQPHTLRGTTSKTLSAEWAVYFKILFSQILDIHSTFVFYDSTRSHIRCLCGTMYNMLADLSTSIVFNLYTQGVINIYPVPREMNIKNVQTNVCKCTCNLFRWALDSSPLIKTHHFIHFTINNGHVGLMIFWFGLI